MPFLTDVNKIAVRRHGDDLWAIVDTIVYRGSVDTFTVPADYVTDFASVPAPVVWLIPRYGRYTPAAILHDYLITDAQPAGSIRSRDTDGLFRRVMRELGVSAPRRWLMWAGVRWGSITGHRWHPEDWATLPGVLAISLAAAPFVLPGALATLWGLAALRVAEVVSPAAPAEPGPPRAVDTGWGRPLLDLDALRARAAGMDERRADRLGDDPEDPT
jgi:hypothetical protein